MWKRREALKNLFKKINQIREDSLNNKPENFLENLPSLKNLPTKIRTKLVVVQNEYLIKKVFPDTLEQLYHYRVVEDKSNRILITSKFGVPYFISFDNKEDLETILTALRKEKFKNFEE